jgi:hypothetical protein
MAGELLLINPRGRKRRKNPARKKARRRNPVRSIRARKRHAVRRHNPARVAKRAYHRRRRNPLSLGGMRSGITGKVTGAVMGAGGALLNDVLLTYVPLPLMLKTGPLAILSKAVGAFAVGYLSSFALGKARGAQLAEGALTVLAYQVARPLVGTMLPLAGDDIEGMGYYSPGMILQDSLSPLTDLNSGTPLQAYISGLGANVTAGQGSQDESDLYSPNISNYDPTINAYIV